MITPVPGRVRRAFDFSDARSMGITPLGSPQASPVPIANGRSPNAKRPVNEASVAVAHAPGRTYSTDDLSAGMTTLYRNSERNNVWVQSIADSVA